MDSFYKNKNVLVTGSSGFIGINLINKLLKLGAYVTGTTHESKPVIISNKVNYIKVDLTKESDCKKAVKHQDYVFMCHGNSFGADVMKSNPKLLVHSNMLMNLNLLNACHEEKVKRILFISSTTIYPPVNYEISEDEGFKDEVFKDYFGVGWMKRYSEKLCEFYHKNYNMNIAIIRPVNLYGPYDKFGEGCHVLPSLIKKALKQDNPFEVWGTEDMVRDYMYIDDFIDQMVVVLDKYANADPINIGTGISTSIRDAVGVILRAVKFDDAQVVYNSDKPDTIHYRKVSIGKSRLLLEMTPSVTFSEGINRTIKWYKENKNKIKR